MENNCLPDLIQTFIYAENVGFNLILELAKFLTSMKQIFHVNLTTRAGVCNILNACFNVRILSSKMHSFVVSCNALSKT